MKIKNLQLSNYCQFAEKSIDFTDGLTAIIGPNGSGKSNILGSIRWLLTGDNPNKGKKAANVYDRADSGALSFGQLSFSHEGIEAVVRRNLQPASPTALLDIEGQDTIEGEHAVNKKIIEIMGIPAATINDIVIVAQSELFSFLAKRPGERAEQFQRLFHTEPADMVYDALGRHLRTIKIPTTGVVIDEAKRELHKVSQNVEELQTVLGGMPTHDVITKNKELNADCVRQFELRQRLQNELSSLAHRRHSQEAERNRLRGELRSVEKQINNLQSVIADVEKVNNARSVLANVKQAEQQFNSRRSVLDKIARLKQEIAQLEEPILPDGHDIVYERQTGVITYELKQTREFLAAFESGSCPTCGTPATALADKMQEARDRISSLVEEFEKVNEHDVMMTNYRSALSSYQVTLSSKQQELLQNENYLKDLPEIQVESVNQEELNEFINDYDKQAALLAQYNSRFQFLDKQTAVADSDVDNLTTLINNKEYELNEVPGYTEQQAQTARDNINGWDQTAADRRHAENSLAVYRTQVSQIQKQIEAAQQAEEQARVLIAWENFANDMRAVVHKDGAPKAVAQRNLQKLQHTINDYLEMFITNYRVRADENLSFKAYLNTGSVQAAERLSGGQKVILALSFRLALNSMFAEDIGALYLDEPTAYLDAHHIRGFEPVLEKLRGLASSRHLQCIIITHERDLAHLFDSVIEL